VSCVFRALLCKGLPHLVAALVHRTPCARWIRAECVRTGATVAGMANDWKLTLGVVASGHDDTHVRLRTLGAGRDPYVVVRVGSVMAHCLGAAAVGSGAQAWAAARARVETGALDFPGFETGGRPGPTGGAGVAVPCGSVVFDGAQRWAVSSVRGAGVLVTIGCVQVQARDRVAFDLHVRAWAEAADLASHAYPGRTVPFSRMVSNARFNDLDRGLGVWLPRDEDPPAPDPTPDVGPDLGP
jgi:hypothetical protein